MRNMLAHYIITINDLARMLKYRVLDRDLSKGRHSERSEVPTPVLFELGWLP